MTLSRRAAAVRFLIAILFAHSMLLAPSARATSGGSGTVGLTALGATYAQNFDTLVNTPDAAMSSALPAAWFIDESGTSARNDGKYTVGTGSSNTGDIYSYGSPVGNAERALGALRSGTLVPIFGASFTNNTGSAITQVVIAYTGEQWRLGTANRGPDRIDFQYSTNAASLTTGTWTDVNALDFSSPITAAAVGALNGNLAANRTLISATVDVPSILPGATLWIRWTDFDVSGADDGLAIDDFSLTANASLSGVGTATPSTLFAGGSSLLSVSVTPGSGPTSTGIAVTGDLSGIGGSPSQSFVDDGSNGDVAAGDNVFSFQATVGNATTPGTKTLPVALSDAQGRTSASSIALTVKPPFREIHEIQGPGLASPFAGQLVTTSGIVTGIRASSGGGFFIQTPEPNVDGDPDTSEGIFVFTAGVIPAAAALGNLVEVTGTAQEFRPSSDPNSPPVTEIAGFATTTLLSTGHPLPNPVTLTAADTSPSGSLEQLERYEGMRVQVDSLTVVAPTEGFKSEANATSTSNGVFFGVITGVARPFREPGIEVPDPLPPGSPCCVPRFDGNPERLRVDSDGQPGTTPLDVTTGALVTGLIGPLDYSSRSYTILPDAATPPSVTGNISATPVPIPVASQFTIASFNMERFFDTVNDPGVSDVALTPTAFSNRLKKVSLAIRNVLRSPDVIGVEEMENLATLQAVANKVNADAVAAGQPDPGYVAYLEEGNDVGGIDVGLLVKSSRVSVIDVTQVGKDDTYINPNNGIAELLNDRPPLVLRAVVGPSGSPFPITVIVNHLRSLSGVDDPTPAGAGTEGARVRAKRRAQAEFLAELIQARQEADHNERIVSVGDYNAFQFNDGYVDSIGTIKGTPTALEEVTLASPDLVDPNLIDLVDLAPADQRYSFLFGGNAQELDHVLVTSNLLPYVTGLHYGRTNADFPEVFRSDSSRPERLSDHDPLVAYFTVAPEVDLSIELAASPNPVVTGSTLIHDIEVQNAAGFAVDALISDPAAGIFTVQGIPGFGSLSLGAPVAISCSLADGIVLSHTASVSLVAPPEGVDPAPSNNLSTISVRVSNPAPLLLAPAPVTAMTGTGAVACSRVVTDAELGDPTFSDNCPGVGVVRSGVPPDNVFPVGQTSVLYLATDSGGASTTATQSVTVLDTTPPSISNPSASPSVIWPPNHKLVDVTISYGASDTCGSASCTLSVTSDEPVNGAGDGNTASDWEVLDAHHVRLHAERAGGGGGRVYTIAIRCADGAANAQTRLVTVTLPKSQGK